MWATKTPNAPYMTLSDINTIITNKTGLSTTEFTNADRAIYMNVYNNIVVSSIYLAQDSADFDDINHGDLPIVNTPLEDAQRDYGLTQAERVMGIKRVDVTYDGSTYYKAHTIDSSDLDFGLGNPADEDNYFSKANPAIDISYGTIRLYPRADATDVAAGAELQVEWTRAPKQLTGSDITTGTVEPGFDDTFHPLLAYGVAFEKSQELGLTNRGELKEMVDNLLGLLEQQYGDKVQDKNLHLENNSNIIAS